jgi:hypothetical protein
MTPRHTLGVGLLAAAGVVAIAGRQDPGPAPTPGPADIVLRGKFVGPTALADAAAVGAHWLEVADEIEWDGLQAEQLYKTGHSLDVLRTRARELRWKGERIGERQKDVQQAAHDYLDQKVGPDGGPLTPERRRAWVEAYRSLGRAAVDAAN